jgi:flavin reductase (DIM6/NTAB) family NADH-FMN oxidoreductase RutF
MERNPIAIENLTLKSYSFFEIDWLLLTCGDYQLGQYNAMTISWGSLGVMWARFFVQVVVRPQRYTRQFIEKFDTFTVCAFPKEYHEALSLLGAKSGRDSNKIAEAGLTPIPAAHVAAPAYAEASLVIECRKIYWQDLDPTHFLDPAINRNYPKKDYHRIYYGEILALQGAEQYQR